MRQTVLSLFDFTGNAVRPWAEAGYRCLCVDVQHPIGETERDGITFIGADVRRYRPPYRLDYAMVFAWPPCTHLSVSGARWFKGKGLFALADSIELFAHAAEICEAIGAPYLIENHVSTISTYWREPDYTFDPCQYALFSPEPEADAYTKRTCLWTGGGFVMPPFHGMEPTHPPGMSPLHCLPPSPDRANLRSATPRGFARAVFDANSSKSAARWLDG